MPLRLVAGVAKKIGLPHYSSLGANCQVEMELDYGLIDHDLEGFRERVRQVHAACRRAVEEELVRGQAAMEASAESRDPGVEEPSQGESSRDGADPSEVAAGHEDHGQPPASSSPSGPNGRNGHREADPERASARQIEYARVLASQIRGLGVRRLDSFCQNLVCTPLADLSASDASRLIDQLKAVRAGTADLASLQEGVAP